MQQHHCYTLAACSPNLTQRGVAEARIDIASQEAALKRTMLRVITLAGCAAALAPPALSIRSATRLQSTAENVAQTQETLLHTVVRYSACYTFLASS